MGVKKRNSPSNGWQSVTYRYRNSRYREFFIFLVVSEKTGTGKKYPEPVSEKFGTGKSLGTGIGKIWYRKKYRYRYRKKFGTGTEFCRTNFGILKICNGYRYRLGTGTGNCSFFLVVSEPVSEKFGTGKKSWNRYRKYLVPEKSLGTGIGKSWYRKKYRYRYRKYLVPEKNIGIV